MIRLTHFALVALLAAAPLAAQTTGSTPVSRGMEIQVRLMGDSTWHTAVVGMMGNADHTCLMVRLAPPDSVTGDFILRRFAGTTAVRTRNAKGEWQLVPEAEFDALQGCSLE